jgi:hypothetical protein
LKMQIQRSSEGVAERCLLVIPNLLLAEYLQLAWVDTQSH